VGGDEGKYPRREAWSADPLPTASVTALGANDKFAKVKVFAFTQLKS